MLSVPRKIRLLDAARKVAPAWAMQRQALVIEHAFDSPMAKEKDMNVRANLASEREWESSEYWGALAEYRSEQLLARARTLYLVPDGMEWVTDGYANRYLNDESLSRLHKLVVEENRKTWEFRFKVVGAAVGALTGLIGTLIGLVAIWKKK